MTKAPRALCAGFALAVLLVARVAAQERDPVLDLLPEGESDLDPIGVGDTSTLRDVAAPSRDEPPPDPTLGPEPPGVEARRGEILWAIPGVREVDHRMDVRLTRGLAVVTEELTFLSRARHRAEVRYRLSVPPDAAPVSLEVCRAQRCRAASPGGGHGYFDAVRAAPEAPGEIAPIAHVDRRAGALVVRAAPVEQGAPTRVRVQWVAPAPARGGVVRLRVPARGSDLRATTASVTVNAEGLLAPSVQGEPVGAAALRIDPWLDLEIAALMPSGGGTNLDIATFPCGERRCGRVRAWGGPRPPERGDYVLLIDASPSTLGPSRGRIGPALAALVATMPPGSTVRAVAFAGHAEALIDEPVAPSEVPLTSVARASGLALGSATRLEAAWGVVQQWGPGLHAIVVGDGGLTTGSGLDRATREARRAGLRLSVLNVGDRPTSAALRTLAQHLHGALVEAGDAADEAARGRSSQRLEEALLPILASPIATDVEVRVGRRRESLGPLYAGEELVWEGPLDGPLMAVANGRRVRARREREPASPWLQAWGRHLTGEVAMSAVAEADRGRPSRSDCHPRGPATRAGGVSSQTSPIALAEPLGCGPPSRAPMDDSEPHGRGVPAETLLQMLRARIVPVARGCFRRDRAGRADYATRAVFHFRLADREVAEAEVEGQLTPALRSCLLTAIDTLDVPYFEGTVRVRYPLYTERAEQAPRIEIEREVLEAVDRIAGDEPTRPAAP